MLGICVVAMAFAAQHQTTEMDPAVVRALGYGSVHRALQLKPTQIKKIDGNLKVHLGLLTQIENAAGAKRNELWVEATSHVAAIAKVLDDQQRKRLGRLSLCQRPLPVAIELVDLLELNLTGDQIRRLRQFEDRWYASAFAFLDTHVGSLKSESVSNDKEFGRLVSGWQKNEARVLDEIQRQRLGQMRLQVLAAKELSRVFQEEKVVKRLQLTKEQKEALLKVVPKQRKPTWDSSERKAFFSAMELLTPEQTNVWYTQLGQPFSSYASAVPNLQRLSAKQPVAEAYWDRIVLSFPIGDIQRRWEWGVAQQNTLEYSWSVQIPGDGKSEFRIAFCLFNWGAAGAGSLEELVSRGQADVWEVTKDGGTLAGEASARVDGDRLIVTATGKRWAGLLRKHRLRTLVFETDGALQALTMQRGRVRHKRTRE